VCYSRMESCIIVSSSTEFSIFLTPIVRHTLDLCLKQSLTRRDLQDSRAYSWFVVGIFKSFSLIFIDFITARRSYATASMVLGVVILSVCLSVRPSVSHTRALCDKTKYCTASIMIAHETAITLLF